MWQFFIGREHLNIFHIYNTFKIREAQFNHRFLKHLVLYLKKTKNFDWKTNQN